MAALRLYRHPGALLITASCFAIGPAIAGPDAGSQIRRFQEETQERLVPRAGDGNAAIPKAPSRTQEAAAAGGATRIYVKAFAVHGVTRFSADEIATVLSGFVGKELDTAGLHATADALNAHYRKAGYFVAKVFIPPQDVADVVRLDVYEGYLDGKGIEVVNKGQRIDARVVQDILDTHLKTGEPIRTADYERALLIAEDLPGVTTASTLYPGQQVGTARLRTTLSDLPFVSGNVDVDNFGNESTGRERLGATLYLNSPGKVGDMAVARVVTSGPRSNYAYLTYLRPISAHGTRIGASVDYYGYDADYVNNLGYSNGYASDTRLYVTHPIIRSRHNNLNIRADLSQLNIDDRNDLHINARRRINSATIALHGDDDQAWLGRGISMADVSLTAGNVDVLGNVAYRILNQFGPQTDGHYARFNYSLSREQQLPGPWSLYGKIRGQLASGNLDASQKMYLGGPTSVSGYPTGEAGGDEGMEIFGELRRDFIPTWGGTLTAGMFYQQGWLKMHKDPWSGWQGTNNIIENRITMKSAGFSVVQTLTNAWVIRGMIGVQLGENPVRNPVTGLTSDGRSDKYRIWAQAIRYF